METGGTVFYGVHNTHDNDNDQSKADIALRKIEDRATVQNVRGVTISMNIVNDIPPAPLALMPMKPSVLQIKSRGWALDNSEWGNIGRFRRHDPLTITVRGHCSHDNGLPS